MSDRCAKQDRRSQKERRHSRGRRHNADSYTCVVELSHRDLRVVVLERSADNAPDRVTASMFTWNEHGQSLHAEAGFRELAKGFSRIVTEHGLQGVNLKVVLGGEYCVTRAVRGTSEAVRFELQRIQSRSRLYLSLGAGEKVVVSNTKALDARHMRALATVCNAKTLETIHRAAEQAGLQLDLIEPALISLCSAVNRLEDVPDEPYLVLHVGQSAAEIGVCHDGQVILDYRPGGSTQAQDLVKLVKQHISRLRRHAGHHLKIAAPRLNRVFLCGEAAAVNGILEEFNTDDTFRTTIVDPNSIQATWQFAQELEDSAMAPVLGTLLSTYRDPSEREAPNLLEHVLASSREPLGPTLLRSVLPIAAMLLVATGLYFVTLRQQGQLKTVQAQVGTLTHELTQTRKLRLRQDQMEMKQQQLEKLAEHLPATPASQVLKCLGQCMPNDIWLQKLEIVDMQTLKISGVSYLEAGVYDFVHWLEHTPGFDEVALHGTRPGHSRSEITVDFNLELTLGNFNAPARKVAHHE